MTLPSTEGRPVNTFTPGVVTTDASGPFDTSKGTVYMVLGGGGTDKRDNVYGAKIANTTTFTQIRTGAKPTADATEPAAWSAMTDPVDAYGVAHFQVDPGKPGEKHHDHRHLLPRAHPDVGHARLHRARDLPAHPAAPRPLLRPPREPREGRRRVGQQGEMVCG